MERDTTVKEFKGDERKDIFITEKFIYVDTVKGHRKEHLEKMKNGEEINLYTIIKMSEIKEVWSKNNSKDVNIILKSGKKKWFEAKSKNIKKEVLNEIENILGKSCIRREKEYSMKERVVTPAVYIIMAVAAAFGMIWLNETQPVLVKRDMIVKASVAGFINILQFIENMKYENVLVCSVLIVSISIVYMLLRIIKPPVKTILKAE